MDSKRLINDLKNVGISKTIGYLSIPEMKKQLKLNSIFHIKKTEFLKNNPEYKSNNLKDGSLDELLPLLTSEETISKIYLGALVTEKSQQNNSHHRKFNIWSINGGQLLGENIPLEKLDNFAAERGIRGGLTDIYGGVVYFYHKPSLSYALTTQKILLEHHQLPTDPDEFIDNIVKINYTKDTHPEVYQFISDLFSNIYLKNHLLEKKSCLKQLDF
jgi:hypothetical protein